MKLDNGYPSTKRCEELNENDEILYNTERISWNTFKAKVKENRKWIYNDCKNENLFKVKIFEKAWKFYGPKFCKNYKNSKGTSEKMVYVSLEEAKK